MNLGMFDMNLLAAFDALYAERSVSKAAIRLGLTQSAVSAALGRLRAYFNDDLFVWNGRKMQVTPKAEAMAPRVKAIVAGTMRVLNEGGDHLANARDDLTIATADIVEWLIGPSLIAEAQRRAPNLTIHMVDTEPEVYSHAGQSGVNLVILPRGFVPPGSAKSKTVLRDRYVIIAGAHNDRVQPGMSSADFLKLPLVMFTALPRETRSSVAGWLLGHDINLECRLRTSHLNNLPAYVEHSDCIAVVTANVARIAARGCAVKVVAPQFPLPDFSIAMFWQEINESDPVQIWLRDTVTAIGQRIELETNHYLTTLERGFS